MAFDFSGKKFVVTGVSKGIGRALTKSLVNCGAEVYGYGRNVDELTSLAAECGELVHVKQLDLADWDATRAEMQSLPPMDGLVNNVGYSVPPIPSVDVTKSDFETVFTINTMAALNVTQIISKKMMEAGKGGAIVNVSSVLGLQPWKGMLAYSMSKAAMDMMTKQFALELGPSNIRVNSVNPTLVLTEKALKILESPDIPDTYAKALAHTPMERYAQMEECTNPILYLLSDYSSMVTGTLHAVDGGLLSNVVV